MLYMLACSQVSVYRPDSLHNFLVVIDPQSAPPDVDGSANGLKGLNECPFIARICVKMLLATLWNHRATSKNGADAGDFARRLFVQLATSQRSKSQTAGANAWPGLADSSVGSASDSWYVSQLQTMVTLKIL